MYCCFWIHWICVQNDGSCISTTDHWGCFF